MQRLPSIGYLHQHTCLLLGTVSQHLAEEGIHVKERQIGRQTYSTITETCRKEKALGDNK